MTSLTGNLACFVNKKSVVLRNIIRVDVEDSIGMGTPEYTEKSNGTVRNFALKKHFQHSDFSRVLIRKQARSFRQHQALVAGRLKELSGSFPFEKL